MAYGIVCCLANGNGALALFKESNLARGLHHGVSLLMNGIMTHDRQLTLTLQHMSPSNFSALHNQDGYICKRLI